MLHRILTCRNHPHLRWSCKEVAWTEDRYTGSRTLFFNGTPSGAGMYEDGSGLSCSRLIRDTEGNVTGVAVECDCPLSDLVIAPEDALLKREG